MAGGKLSPRQKMINMMYLVLTALLAMNVSKEILNSFAILNNGLQKTNESFTEKNEVTYNAFEMAKLNDPNKVQKYYTKAMAVKDRSKQMYDYIEVIKKELIRTIEQKDSIITQNSTGQDTLIRLVQNIAYMDGKDNYDIPTHYFLGDATGEAPQGSKAFEFKDMLTKYRQDMMAMLDERDKKTIKLGIDISDVFSAAEGKKVKWEINNFYHNPAAAVIAILTKLQNDVKNAEADIIGALYKNIDLMTYKFDTLSARVVANSNYVLLGEEYRAEIFLAAFSSTSNPVIKLGEVDSVTNTIKGAADTSSVKVHKGVGTYTFTPSAEGTISYGGLIGMKDPVDPKKINYYPFKSEFKAARPAIVVSPDKMNVFYIGIDNPVSISVPGIAAEDLQPSLSGGSISGSRGKYNVRVGAGKEATVNVSARTRNGVKSMGAGIKFRVKPVPNPVPEFMGKRGTDVIKQAELTGAQGVMAKLDNFEFDLKFPVVSFSVSMNVNGSEVEAKANGPALTDEQKSLLRKAKKGNKVYIENVKVKKPDGNVVNIGSVNLKVI